MYVVLQRCVTRWHGHIVWVPHLHMRCIMLARHLVRCVTEFPPLTLQNFWRIYELWCQWVRECLP